MGLGLALSQGLNALAYLITARTLGPAEFGQLVALVGVGLVVVAMTDLGLNNHTIRALAADPSAVPLLRQNSGARLLIATTVGLAWVLGSVLLLSSELRLAGILTGAYLTANMAENVWLAPMRARQEMWRVSRCVVADKAIALGMVAGLFAVFPPSPALFPLALSTGAIAGALTALSLLRVGERAPRIPKLRTLLETLNTSRHFAVAGLAGEAQRGDAAIVAAISGDQAAGIYGAPTRLGPALLLFANAYRGAVFPRLSETGGSTATSLHQARRNNAIKGVHALLFVNTIIYGCVLILADQLVALVFGAEYAESAEVLRIYLLALWFAALNGPLASILQAEHEEVFVGRVIASATAIGLALVTLGAMLNGAAGAAWGAVASQAWTSAFSYYRIRWPGSARSGT